MNAMIVKIFVIVFLAESIVLHEMAHGYVAWLFGDQTAKRQGRIIFNPIAHIDSLWTIAIPIVAYFLSRGTFIIGGARTFNGIFVTGILAVLLASIITGRRG